MLLRILQETFRRRKRRMVAAILAVLVGSSLSAALLTISADLSGKMTQEMRAYGANILISPQNLGAESEKAGVVSASRSYIDESELVKLKTIFWRNNIVGFAPYLSLLVDDDKSGEQFVLTGTWFEKDLVLPAGTQIRSTFGRQDAIDGNVSFKTGTKSVAPWWRIEGNWVADGDRQGALVGTELAQRLNLRIGDTFTVKYAEKLQQLKITGIVYAGGMEDSQVFVNLPVAQDLVGTRTGADKVLVSALTLPKEKLAPEIRNKKPEEMTPKEYETWYCSPVVDAIVTQINEAIPGVEAKPIRQISEAEGSFATKVESMILLVTIIALAASSLGVMTTVTTTVLERRSEIGLMKAIGADNRQVATIFLAEAATVGVLGGGLGYAAGSQLASFIGASVFNSPIAANWLLLPVTLALAIAVALSGSALPMRSAMRVQPVTLLKGS